MSEEATGTVQAAGDTQTGQQAEPKVSDNGADKKKPEKVTEKKPDSPSILDIVTEEAGKRPGKPEKQTELEGKKTGEGDEVKKDEKTETDKGKESAKEPVKKTANERIQQLVDEKNELKGKLEGANTQMQAEVETLKQQVQHLTGQLSKGQITEKQAGAGAKTAEAAFKKAIESIELSEDLQPFKNEIVGMAKTIADTIVQAELAPIKQSLEAEKQRKEAEAKEKQAREQTEFTDTLFKTFDKGVETYPHLFEKPKKEGERPELKPEFDKMAEEIIKPFWVPFYNPETKKTEQSNALLQTPEGLEMLLERLNRDFDKAEKLKAQAKEQDKIKKNRVESPQTGKSVSKAMNILDIVNEEAERIEKRGG